jgi:predicted TIM-barrel fold metal-dependent hydrolase
MYGNISAGSGLNFLQRDEDFTSDYLKRHQNKIIFGSDCADTAGHGNACDGAQIISTIKRLAPSKKIERKILYGNAKKMFQL